VERWAPCPGSTSFKSKNGRRLTAEKVTNGMLTSMLMRARPLEISQPLASNVLASPWAVFPFLPVLERAAQKPR